MGACDLMVHMNGELRDKSKVKNKDKSTLVLHCCRVSSINKVKAIYTYCNEWLIDEHSFLQSRGCSTLFGLQSS